MVKRIEYIDNLKSFAILLVVVGHAISMIWGNSDGSDIPLYVFIYSFQMPLFMFLSGLCVNPAVLDMKENTVALLFISIVVSLANILLCWFINKLLSQNKYLLLLLFGIKK